MTVSAAYGAGGSLVGAALAERLGFRFMDRAITVEVAQRLGLPAEDIDAHEQQLHSGLARFLAYFGSASPLSGVPVAANSPSVDERAYRQQADTVIREAAERGTVIVGRGAAIVLHGHPGAVHTRLDGPAPQRIAQAADFGGLSLEQAKQQQRRADRIRETYVRHFYQADPTDNRHYHLVLDATALPLAACVESILAAVHGRDELARLA